MKRFTGIVVFGMLLASFALVAQPTDRLIAKNVGLILDTPFLHQSDRPFESEFFGTFGDEVISYEYDGDGMPTFIRFADIDTRSPYMDVEVTYRRDGQIDTLVYTTYDESDESIAYVEAFHFSEYTRTGPAFGLMTTDDGFTSEMRLAYDETGRLVSIEEDDAFGVGLFRHERYAWTGEGTDSLPYAIELRFPLDGEIERYRYLYDATGRLEGLDGVSMLESDPNDQTPVSEWYYYRSRTFDEIFGRIEPTSTEAQSTALR